MGRFRYITVLPRSRCTGHLAQAVDAWTAVPMDGSAGKRAPPNRADTYFHMFKLPKARATLTGTSRDVAPMIQPPGIKQRKDLFP